MHMCIYIEIGIWIYTYMYMHIYYTIMNEASIYGINFINNSFLMYSSFSVAECTKINLLKSISYWEHLATMWQLRVHMPQPKIPHAPTKTQCSKINERVFFYKKNIFLLITYFWHIWVCVWVWVGPQACVLSHFSHVRLFATLQTVARQAPLSMRFSRQEYWSGLPCLDLLHYSRFFTVWATKEALSSPPGVYNF